MIPRPSALNYFSTSELRASGLCVVRLWKVGAVSSGPLGPAGPFWYTCLPRVLGPDPRDPRAVLHPLEGAPPRGPGTHDAHHRERGLSGSPQHELELELLQPHMAQCCGVKWGARVLRVRSVSREEVWASAGVQGAWVGGCGCEAD